MSYRQVVETGPFGLTLGPCHEQDGGGQVGSRGVMHISKQTGLETGPSSGLSGLVMGKRGGRSGRVGPCHATSCQQASVKRLTTSGLIIAYGHGQASCGVMPYESAVKRSRQGPSV
jgi:hypothetical protein